MISAVAVMLDGHDYKAGVSRSQGRCKGPMYIEVRLAVSLGKHQRITEEAKWRSQVCGDLVRQVVKVLGQLAGRKRCDESGV